MHERITPLVYLVGAGPGDPGLLTLRAAECLHRADVVLHDKLVSPRVLDLAPAAALRISVEDLPGKHPERWPHIHRTMIDHARAGRVVVRLKGGDPFIFGRGGEEVEALRDADIPYEIVPGVSAALAAGAYAEIPLTHRACASAVALVTGHENPTKSGISLDWQALARFPGTLAIYMGMARLELIVQVLLQHGKPPDTPAAVVQLASTGHQQTRTTTLDRLDQMVRDEGLMPPAVILIGPVVRLQPNLSWFDRRPLRGARVLVTRPKHQAGEMFDRLEELGAIPYLLSAVEVRDPPDWGPVDDAVRRLADYQWLVFTSSNAVQKFIGRLLTLGLDLRHVAPVKLAVIGPGTAEALRRFHLHADIMPAAFRSEDLADALRESVRGRRVLLARADRGRDVLLRELSAVADVDQVAVYSQVDAVEPNNAVLRALNRGEIGYITLTSANIARAVLRLLDDTGRMRIERGTVKIASISPITSAAVHELGLPVAAEAEEFTIDGLMAALLRLHRMADGKLPAVVPEPSG